MNSVRLSGSAKGRADDAARRRNDSQVFAFRADYLNTRVRADVKTAFAVDRRSVAVAPALERCEHALVGQRTVGLDVERRNRLTVRHVERLFIGAQNDPVGSNVLAVLRDDAVSVPHSRPRPG